MKRWPAVASFVLFLLICASAAFWAMQLIKPPVRPVAPPTAAASAVLPSASAAAGLFGGRAGPTPVASNFQLVGVVMAGRPSESIAILSANGKPAQYVVADTEVQPGVKVKEVHRDYAVLSDHGVDKRVALPAEAKSSGGIASGASTAPLGAPRSSPAMPTTLVSPSTPSSGALSSAPSTASAPTSAMSGTGNMPSGAPNVNPRGAAQPGLPQTPPPLQGQNGAAMSGTSGAGQTASGVEGSEPATAGASPAVGSQTNSAGSSGTAGAAVTSGTTGTAASATPRTNAGTGQRSQPSSPSSAGAMVQPYQPFSTQPRQ